MSFKNWGNKEASLEALYLLDSAFLEPGEEYLRLISKTKGENGLRYVVDNGQGDLLDVIFTREAVLVRGFDHENKLNSLNVQGCSALTYLSCGDNQLTSLDVNALNALEELYCYANQLTLLNVQGCSALSNMDCRSNKLGSSAFIKLFDDLPASGGECYIYLDDKSEGNHKNFNAPEKLKQAFNKAKTEKNWTMYKYEEDWSQTKI